MPRRTGLTKETFMAIIQTVSALPRLAEYLMEAKGLKFVLLGMINSDPIEKKFGGYRQGSGGNYFTGVRQFLENEKAMRIECLVKHWLNFEDIRKVFSDCKGPVNEEQLAADVREICAALADTFSAEFTLEHGEEGIIFFIAGYAARALVKSTSCKSCISMLRKDETQPMIEMESDGTGSDAEKEFKEGYLELINRGGLASPSDIVNVTCVHAVHLRKLLFDGHTLEKLFLATEQPQKVFVQAFVLQMRNDLDTENIMEQQCEIGHPFGNFVPKIAHCAYNIFSKNFISDQNDKIHEARKRKKDDKTDKTEKKSPAKRKIAKLQANKK